MTLANANPHRILTYGLDGVLLDTRQAILKSAGFITDIALTFGEFRSRVQMSATPYDLYILCHTVPLQQSEWIGDNAADTGTRVYALHTSVSPESFVNHVRKLLRTE